MKQISIALLCLVSLTVFGQGRFVSWNRFSASTVSVCTASPSPYLIWQGFECSPFDHGPESWVTNGTAGLDYIGTPLSGTKSIHFTNSPSQADLTTASFGNQSDVWAYFMIRPLDLTQSGSFEIIAAWLTSGGGMNANLSIASDHTLRIASSSVGNTVATMSINTTYQVWFHYKPSTGSDGVVDVGFSTNGTRPTSGNNFAQITGQTLTGQIDKFSLKHATGNPTTMQLLCDNALVKTSQIGDNPP